jgi:hypothetical protein
MYQDHYLIVFRFLPWIFSQELPNSFGSILTSKPDRGVLIKFIYEKLLSTEAVEEGMIFNRLGGNYQKSQQKPWV